MFVLPRRWRSIDTTLPLLASGLVVLAVAALAWTSYALLARGLVEANRERLHSSARVVAQMIGRPGMSGIRAADAASRAADDTMRAFLRGSVSHEAALRAVARPFGFGDSSKVYAALFDSAGIPVAVYERGQLREPQWPRTALAAQSISGDTISLGPFENFSGVPAYTTARALHDSTRRNAPLLGYVVETRAIVGRNLQAFRNVVGREVLMAVGQPGVGVYTDLERIVSAPAIPASGDSVIVNDDGVAAWASLPGTSWVVWLSQPMRAVLAPARTLLWSVLPIGLLIALGGAALMWRIARRITHPIVELTDVAEGVARDSRSLPRTDELPAHVAGADEVTRLRFAFERMAERIAEREQLEEQLRHAQKMEAVGRLAGGVAHDFNNLLTAIRSYADLMLDDMSAWDPKRSDVQEIRKAAQRATTLTAQLLAFSRKSMLQPRVLDTAAVLTDIHGMLRRLLIEDIALELHAASGLWPVKVDRGQLEQVVVNLAVNARDAMPNGGTLRITGTNSVLTRAMETPHGTVPAGEYVALQVQDTGAGMDEVTRARAFEPFFTTKEVGHGTGLGLATVHGIVAQSGGYVTLHSEVGLGSTFTVYLPRALEVPAADRQVNVSSLQGRNETVLLVEDEQAVRALARRVLVRAGFRVLESATPSDALRLAQQHAAEIKLVLSDVVMPEMSGPALVDKIAGIVPSARVLYISGYTDDEVFGRGLANPGMQLLQKPFSAQQLVERVRLAIDTG